MGDGHVLTMQAPATPARVAALRGGGGARDETESLAYLPQMPVRGHVIITLAKNVAVRGVSPSLPWPGSPSCAPSASTDRVDHRL